MLCSNCNKNEANFHYTQITNGKYTQMHLCSECASQFGYMNHGFGHSFGLENIINDIFGLGTPKTQSVVLKTCTECNTSLSQFLKSGVAGCPECYNQFSDAVEKILSGIQPSSTHSGTISGENGEKITKKNKLASLKEDLKLAILEERYEDAAKIRDIIKNEEINSTEGGEN